MERIVIDYLAEELKDLEFQQKVEETARWARGVKMTEQQKSEYKLYRAACRVSGVEPTRADFLLGDIPSCVMGEMDWQRKQQPKTMGVVVER